MSADLHVIIPAGGAGTRLWPLSRRSRPKFLLDLTGAGRSLLQATVDRMAPVAASVTIVTGVAHRNGVLEQLPEFGDPAREDRRLVIEPSPRDSMPAIGLATYLVRERFGEDALVGSFAADHVIARPDLLDEALVAAQVAAGRGFVTTIGITPTAASTAYGYIKPGAVLDGGPARAVERFVEKPDAPTAAAYVDAGYLWNAGMFVMAAGTLAGHLRDSDPAMHEGLSRIAAAWGGAGGEQVLDREWPGLRKIAIDHAIAEPVAAAGGVAVVPAGADLGWSDLGDFEALGELTADEGEAVRVDAPSNRVYSTSGQTVSLVGVSDLVVVVTPDAVMVTRPGAAQDVKRVVDELREEGRTDLL